MNRQKLLRVGAGNRDQDWQPGIGSMNRRRFLQASAAGLALTGLAAYAAEFSDPKKRVGLIGCGWVGKCDLFPLIPVSPVGGVSLCDVDKRLLVEAAGMGTLRE